MDDNSRRRNERLAQTVIKGLQSRNMSGYYAENKEDALYEYHQCIEKLHHIYDKYESHERFLKSRHLHIRHYIEEASMQNLPLEECLINHLGKEQGHSVYKEYVS